MYVLPDAEFSGSSSKAIDAKTQLDNQLGGSSITNIPKGITDAIGCFSAQTRAKDKAANRFYLVSMANSGPGGQVSAAAEYKYLPIGRDKDEEDCAKVFGTGAVNCISVCGDENARICVGGQAADIIVYQLKVMHFLKS